jgi:hypothetical protein
MPFPAVIALGAGVSWLYKTIRMDEAEQDDEAERDARDAAYERTGPIPRELLGQGNWFFVRQAHTFEAHAGFSGTAQVVRWQIVIDTVTHHIKVQTTCPRVRTPDKTSRGRAAQLARATC